MKFKFTAFIAFLLITCFAVSNSSAKDFNLKEFKNKLPELLGSNNVGTDFWVTFNPCWESSGAKNDLKLYVSSGVITTVTVEIPGKGYLKQQKTIPNDVIEFTLSPALGQCYRKTDRQPPEPEQVYGGYGIHVYAPQPIIVYGATRDQYTSDSYLALPKSSLGKEYVVASWCDISDFGVQYLPGYTGIVSPFDNNKVRFTMGGTSGSRTAGGLEPGETRNYTLWKGDVLLISTFGQRADISGSRIRATKPVSVLSSNFCAYVPENTPYCDYMSEYELPTNTWGTEYHYTPIAGRLKNSIIKIFTKEAGTSIYLDRQHIATLRTGAGLENDGWLRFRAENGTPRPIVFSGDKPIYIMQYNTGNNDDGRVVQTDPFMLVLTPLEQYQREIIFNTPGINGGFGFPKNWINIIYRANDDGSIPDDLEFATVIAGNFIWKKLKTISPNPGLPFSVKVNGLIYYCKQMELPGDGVYKIRANDPFAAYAYGNSSDDSYGHPTSVALGDLEKPDTLPPNPTWTFDCSENGTYETYGELVEDMPRNNDRSNLSLIIFDAEASFNFRFTYVDFVPGEDAYTKWHAWVVDPSKDGRAVITFIDRRGNDTTIVIIYNAVKLAIRPNLDFGLLAVGESKEMDCWVINESKTSEVKIKDLMLKKLFPGFDIFGFVLPLTIQANDSVKFTVRFTATTNGEFKDSIGVGDSCIFAYKAEVKARVGSAKIDVTYYDFGDVPVNSTANGSIEIRNLGTINLVITGYTGPRQPSIFFPDLIIDQNNPLTLTPGQVFSYEVIFLPLDTIVYTDSMFFISNTEKDNVDSIGDLRGRGIKPDLVANGYDWGRRRIDRQPNFPAGPYDPDNGYQVIKLYNGGTMAVTIYIIKTIRDVNGYAFEFDRGQLANRQIQPYDSIIVPVKFHPTATGPHELILEYDNTAGSSTQTILRGIGIVPQTVTADVDFGSTVLQDYTNPNTRLVRFTNKPDADWAYGDSVTITDFLVVPTGTIATDLVSWGTEGFRYDKLALTLPIKLGQGEFIEFDAQFVADKVPQSSASLSTVSDAENEVTSNWTGAGIAQGIEVTAGQVQTCVYDPQIIKCVVTNTGSDDLVVDSVRILPLDIPSQGQFEFVNPIDTDTFNLPAGASRDIEIRYKAMPGTPVTDKATHRADLVVYNNSLFIPEAVSVTPVQGVCEHHNLTTTLSLSTNLTKIGTEVYGTITLDPNTEDITLADIHSLDFVMKYNGDFLKVNKEDIELTGGLLDNKYTISNTNINDVTGTISFTLSGTDLFNYPGGKLVGFKIGTYLPKDVYSSSLVIHTVATNNACVDIKTNNDSIAVEPTCVFDLRKIVMSTTTYGLQSINPNPVTNSNAEIEFSVGLKGYTEIKIYNSNSGIVAIPVKEELEPGLYKINLDVANMTNGVYWYEMTSGPFHSTEKMVIAR